MEDSASGGYLNNLHRMRMNLIGGYISSYCSILNSLKQIDMIKQNNELADILGDIESNCLRENRIGRIERWRQRYRVKINLNRIRGGNIRRGQSVFILVKFWFVHFWDMVLITSRISK